MPRYKGDWKRINRWRWERERIGGAVEVAEATRREASKHWRVYLANDAGAVLYRLDGSISTAEAAKRAAGRLPIV